MVVDMRVSEYLEYISIARNLSPLTVAHAKHVLAKFIEVLGSQDVSDITFRDLENWMLQQANEPNFHGNIKKPSTINTERAVLRAFFRYCRNSGEPMKFDSANIVNMKVRNHRKKALRPEEIVEVARQINYDKLRLTVLVTFYAGLRIGEAIKLYPSNLDGCTLRIEDSKSEEPRPAFLPPDLAEELRIYVTVNHINGRIFPYGKQIPSVHYERYSTNGVRKQMQKHFLKLGYTMSPHDLRHAYATMLRRNGADIYDIKELMGHSDVRTTQIYIHMEDAELQAKHAKYSISY